MSLEALLIICAIGVLTFFTLQWVLRRFISDRKVRERSTVLGTVILTPVIYSGLIYLFIHSLFYEPQFEFSRERWFRDKNARFEMRDDIVKSKILIGKTKEEVLGFIGESEYGDSTDVWFYDLGMSSHGFGWQLNTLELHFENGKVSKAKNNEAID